MKLQLCLSSFLSFQVDEALGPFNVKNGDILVSLDDQRLFSASASREVINEVIKHGRRPIVLELVRNAAPKITSHDSAPPKVSRHVTTRLNFDIEVGLVSALLLYHKEIFSYAGLREARARFSTDKFSATLVEMSITSVHILDLTPQGSKHRDVVKSTGNEALHAAIVLKIHAVDSKTSLEVSFFLNRAGDTNILTFSCVSGFTKRSANMLSWAIRARASLLLQRHDRFSTERIDERRRRERGRR